MDQVQKVINGLEVLKGAWGKKTRMRNWGGVLQFWCEDLSSKGIKGARAEKLKRNGFVPHASNSIQYWSLDIPDI